MPGDYSKVDPPVPIPNTEVKHFSAHDSYLFSENRSLPGTLLKWRLSSVGRAPALQAGGQRFKSVSLHQKRNAEIAQSGRATDL